MLEKNITKRYGPGCRNVVFYDYSREHGTDSILTEKERLVKLMKLLKTKRVFGFLAAVLMSFSLLVPTAQAGNMAARKPVSPSYCPNCNALLSKSGPSPSTRAVPCHKGGNNYDLEIFGGLIYSCSCGYSRDETFVKEVFCPH